MFGLCHAQTALPIIGLTDEDQANLYKIIASILLFGEVGFFENDLQKSEVHAYEIHPQCKCARNEQMIDKSHVRTQINAGRDQACLELLCSNLGVSAQKLITGLTERKMKLGGEMVSKPRSTVESTRSRDALAKVARSIYSLPRCSPPLALSTPLITSQHTLLPSPTAAPKHTLVL